MASALELAGHSARLVFVGIDVGATVPAQLGLIQSKALRIRGIIGSPGIWPKTIRLLASGVVDPTAIVTASFPLASALDALEAARDTASNIKVHIRTGMRAAVYHGPGDVRIESVPDPAARARRARRRGRAARSAARTRASGRTDRCSARPPVVLGHEYVGRVVGERARAAGSRWATASSPAPAWPAASASGAAPAARTSARTTTRSGLHTDGGLAEYVRTPADICVAVPDGCGDDAAAMAQPLAVAMHAVRRGRVQPGRRSWSSASAASAR